MKPVTPVIPSADLKEIMVAEHQKEYGTLPAVNCGDGVLLTRWKLSEEEIETIRKTGDIYLYIWTHGNPVQPVMLQVETPEHAVAEDECLSASVIE